MEKGQREHDKLMYRAAKLVRRKYRLTDALVLGAGGCRVCRRCTYPDKPCRYPEKAFSAIEGYGLDVQKITRLAGLPCSWSEPRVCFCGLIYLPEEKIFTANVYENK